MKLRVKTGSAYWDLEYGFLKGSIHVLRVLQEYVCCSKHISVHTLSEANWKSGRGHRGIPHGLP